MKGNRDPVADLAQCLTEQKRCADYLLEHGPHRGAALGLFDNFVEEFLIREELDARDILST